MKRHLLTVWGKNHCFQAFPSILKRNCCSFFRPILSKRLSGLLISQLFCLENASTFIDTKVDKAQFWDLGKMTKWHSSVNLLLIERSRVECVEQVVIPSALYKLFRQVRFLLTNKVASHSVFVSPIDNGFARSVTSKRGQLFLFFQ